MSQWYITPDKRHSNFMEKSDTDFTENDLVRQSETLTKPIEDNLAARNKARHAMDRRRGVNWKGNGRP